MHHSLLIWYVDMWHSTADAAANATIISTAFQNVNQWKKKTNWLSNFFNQGITIGTDYTSLFVFVIMLIFYYMRQPFLLINNIFQRVEEVEYIQWLSSVVNHICCIIGFPGECSVSIEVVHFIVCMLKTDWLLNHHLVFCRHNGIGI